MKKTTEQLLDDLLEDSAPTEFRAALMDKTLGTARRRKQTRRFKLATGGGVIAVILLLSLWRTREPAQIVTTHSGSSDKFATFSSTPTVVRTSGSAAPFQEINDKQLMALFGDKSAILIRRGPHQAELIVVNSELQ